MFRTNKDFLVELSLTGSLAPAEAVLHSQGMSSAIPGSGGICHSHRIGDSSTELVGENIEPGVSLCNSSSPSFFLLSSIGNKVSVLSGDAKGAIGVVTGKHRATGNVLVDFPEHVLDKLTANDLFRVHAVGAGLKLLDFPHVGIAHCAPEFVGKWKLRGLQNGLQVAVSHLLPAKVLCRGLNEQCDVQLSDRRVVLEFSLDMMRFGDIVALLDIESFSSGGGAQQYVGGAVTIGVVVCGTGIDGTSSSRILPVLSSAEGGIIPKLSRDANIGKMLQIGKWRKRPAKNSKGKKKI